LTYTHQHMILAAEQIVEEMAAMDETLSLMDGMVE
jgi:hypothetical protein